MRNQFPGYYKPSKEEFEELWKNCIFSFDTNILLNVYRYSPKARERLFEIWRKLNERIWLPNQVAFEYLQERLTVISHQLKPYKELQEVLDDAAKRFTEKIEEFSKRHSFNSYTDAKKLSMILEDAHNKIKEELKASSASCPDLLESDSFWVEITQIFDGKVGEPYSEEDLSKYFKKSESRFKNQQPPGYQDAKKPETERYGDVIIWFQLIDYVKSQKKPLVFVTDDEKEDWWLKHKGKTIGPRPELIQEMVEKGGIQFYLYTSDRFLEYAAEFLKLEDGQEVIKEAAEIRHQVEAEGISASVDKYKSALGSLRKFHQVFTDSIDSDTLIKINALGKAIKALSLQPETSASLKNIAEFNRTLIESESWKKAAHSLSVVAASQSMDKLIQTRSLINREVENRFLDAVADATSDTTGIEDVEKEN
jgi:PIN like domain